MTERKWKTTDDILAMLEFLHKRRRLSSPRLRKLFLLKIEAWRRVSPLPDKETPLWEKYIEGKISAQQFGKAYKEATNARHTPNIDETIDAGVIDAFVESLVTVSSQFKDSEAEHLAQVALIRDIFGNPFRPVPLNPSWQTTTVVSLAQAVYDQRAYERMPILADALEDAGCTNEEVLAHARGEGPHVRGCWLIDLLLGKE
jgi:hypothetical protein